MRLRLSVSLVLAAVLLGTGLPPADAATAAPVLVTPAQATRVLDGYLAAWNVASTALDTSVLDAVEGGSARRLDDADFRLDDEVGYAPYDPVVDVSQRVYLPRQTHYPLVFLAVTRRRSGSEQPDRNLRLLLFQRPSSRAVWRVTAAPTVTPTALPAFTVGKDGYLPTLDASTLALPPAQLYASLLAAMTVAASGAGVTPPWVDDSVWRTISNTASAAVDLRQTFASTHLVPVCLAATRGAVCFASAIEVSDSVLDPSESAAGYYYDLETLQDSYDAGGVAVGHYSSLHRVAIEELLVQVPRKQANYKVVLTGQRWGPISGSGVTR